MSEQNGNGLSRMDRIERALELFIADHEQFREEHKQLLTAQVVLTERVDKLSVSMEKLTVKMNELAETQKHTGERMDALIGVVDDLIPEASAELI